MTKRGNSRFALEKQSKTTSAPEIHVNINDASNRTSKYKAPPPKAPEVAKIRETFSTAELLTTKSYLIWFWEKKHEKYTRIERKLATKLEFQNHAFIFTMDEKSRLFFRLEGDPNKHELHPRKVKTILKTICIMADICWFAPSDLSEDVAPDASSYHHDDGDYPRD